MSASLERLYLPRKQGGRGLFGLKHMWEREMVATAVYLCYTDDSHLKGVAAYLGETGNGPHYLLKEANQIQIGRAHV